MAIHSHKTGIDSGHQKSEECGYDWPEEIDRVVEPIMGGGRGASTACSTTAWTLPRPKSLAPPLLPTISSTTGSTPLG
jgi:hypothetical protein